MKPLFFILILAGVTFAGTRTPAFAGATTTDSIDLFKTDPADSVKKSLALALTASFILPGAGHQYLDRNNSAIVYLSAEAVSIFAFFFCDHNANKIAQDAAGFAWIHAKATGSIHDADEYRWKLIGNYMDVQEYNTVMELNRTPEKMIVDESRSWYWDDITSKERFNEIRTSSRSYRVISNFFVGAMVLDRVIAFIDIRTSTRNKSIKHSRRASFNLTPELRATQNSMELALSGTF